MKSLKDNPNIIKFIDNFKASESVFIAMEYCEDGSLYDLLSKAGPLPE